VPTIAWGLLLVWLPLYAARIIWLNSDDGARHVRPGTQGDREHVHYLRIVTRTAMAHSEENAQPDRVREHIRKMLERLRTRGKRKPSSGGSVPRSSAQPSALPNRVKRDRE
jgi:hypothetical protein